jgi:hypothetical protein
MQRATRDFAPIGQIADDFEPDRVAQGVEHVRKAHILESWVVEIPHCGLGSTTTEPSKIIAKA